MAMKMIKKIAVPVATAVLLILVAVNAYLALNTLLRLRKNVALTAESSAIHAGVSNVLRDLTDMETGQRGYLLTANDSYLQPYAEAKARIATDFTALRTGLAHSTEQQRSLESQVESLAESKRAEIERSLSLRQQGYRRRAFRLVDSNEGFEYMDKARTALASLSHAEDSVITRLGRERSSILNKALVATIAANACLLMMTGCLFALIRRYGRMLESEAAQAREELSRRDIRLENLRSVLSNQARSKTFAIEANARMLLQTYGGFLPRHGHECAEQIREASEQMEQLRQDLVGNPTCMDHEDEDATVASVA
jgi:CHASE3 domain sensor protein